MTNAFKRSCCAMFEYGYCVVASNDRIICVKAKEKKHEIGTSECDECANFNHFQLCSRTDQFKWILSPEIFYCSDILENNSVAQSNIYFWIVWAFGTAETHFKRCQSNLSKVLDINKCKAKLHQWIKAIFFEIFSNQIRSEKDFTGFQANQSDPFEPISEINWTIGIRIEFQAFFRNIRRYLQIESYQSIDADFQVVLFGISSIFSEFHQPKEYALYYKRLKHFFRNFKHFFQN